MADIEPTIICGSSRLSEKLIHTIIAVVIAATLACLPDRGWCSPSAVRLIQFNLHSEASRTGKTRGR